MPKRDKYAQNANALKEAFAKGAAPAPKVKTKPKPKPRGKAKAKAKSQSQQKSVFDAPAPMKGSCSTSSKAMADCSGAPYQKVTPSKRKDYAQSCRESLDIAAEGDAKRFRSLESAAGTAERHAALDVVHTTLAAGAFDENSPVMNTEATLILPEFASSKTSEEVPSTEDAHSTHTDQPPPPHVTEEAKVFTPDTPDP